MISTSIFAPIEGGCRCGQARYRMQNAPIITHACHCRQCQQTSGSAFQISAMIETDRLLLIHGRTQVVQFSKNHKRVQCPDCGCARWIHRADLGNVVASVGVGTLDPGHPLKPEAHYFVRSKLDWVELPLDVPAFDDLGTPGKAGVGDRIEAALAGVNRDDTNDAH